MRQNFYLIGVGEYMDVSRQARSGFLRFSTPGGEYFDLQVSEPQLSTVLGYVAGAQGAPAGAPAPARRQPDLSGRGAVDVEPLNYGEGLDTDLDEPITLRAPILGNMSAPFGDHDEDEL